MRSACARGAMMSTLERMQDQLPPRLKMLLNLAISVVLVLMAVPLVFVGLTTMAWGEAAMGLGLLLLAVFNLFT